MTNDLNRNYFFNRYVAEAGGIPDAEPSWVLRDARFGAMHSSWAVLDDALYIRSAGEGWHFRVDVDSGAIRWASSVAENDGSPVYRIGRFVGIGWYRQDAASGAVHADLRQVLDQPRTSPFIGIATMSSVVCRVLEPTPELVIVDADTLAVRRLGTDLIGLQLSSDLTGVLGWNESAYRCHSLETGESLWSVDVGHTEKGKRNSAGGVVAGDVVFIHRGIASVERRAASTGELLATTGSSGSDPEQGSQRPFGKILASEDVVVLLRAEMGRSLIRALSAETLKLLWEREIAGSVRNPIIAGHLLFYLHGVALDKVSQVAGVDVLTGASVWEMGDPMPAIIQVMVAGRSLVCSNTLGEFRRYAWREVYRGRG